MWQLESCNQDLSGRGEEEGRRLLGCRGNIRSTTFKIAGGSCIYPGCGLSLVMSRAVVKPVLVQVLRVDRTGSRQTGWSVGCLSLAVWSVLVMELQHSLLVSAETGLSSRHTSIYA
jgi:hypothetical protein